MRPTCPTSKKVQAGYKAQPLSAYLKQPAPPAAPAIDFPKIDKEMVKLDFFEYLDFPLQFAPPGPEEATSARSSPASASERARQFDFKDLSEEHKAAVLLGMKEGDDKIGSKSLTTGKNINGWRVGSGIRRPAFLQRRLAAARGRSQAGIYGNDAVEAMYPMTRTDATGEPLDGSKHNYTLTFPQGSSRR